MQYPSRSIRIRKSRFDITWTWDLLGPVNEGSSPMGRILSVYMSLLESCPVSELLNDGPTLYHSAHRKQFDRTGYC